MNCCETCSNRPTLRGRERGFREFQDKGFFPEQISRVSGTDPFPEYNNSKVEKLDMFIDISVLCHGFEKYFQR